MKTPRPGILILAVLAAFIAAAVAAPADADKVRDGWQPPAAKTLGSVTGKKLACAHYSTTKPLSEVWTHYAQKLGIKDHNPPPSSYSTSSRTSADASVETSVVSTRDHGAATRAVTLIRRAGGQTIIIHLSVAASETETLVSVIAETQ